MPQSPRFLLLQARPQADARAAEAASFARAMGAEGRLDTVRIDVEPMPADALTRYAAVVVGGSPYNVTDDAQAKSAGQRAAEGTLAGLAESALADGYPVFFTCFSIGILTTVLGGTVDLAHPERVSAATNSLTAAGAADPVAGVLPTEFAVLTGHKESAPSVPPGATLLATNSVSPVQLYRVGSVLASQFHPEPTIADFIERATIYQHHGYFPPAELAGIAADLRAASVTEPQKLLRRFAEVSARRGEAAGRDDA